MRARWDLTGLDRILVRLGRYQLTPAHWLQLGEALESVIVEDNRKGVLSGTDRDGNPLAKVMYRTGRNARTRFRSPGDAGFGTVAGRFKGRTGRGRRLNLWVNEAFYRGSISGKGKPGATGVNWDAKRRKEALARGTLPNGNLTTAQYRQLTGPPLAPRGEQSRVITNLVTRSTATAHGVVAEGGWKDVLSADGTPFLRFHFRGGGRLPRRDLRGVRPQGRALALRLAREWFRKITRP